MTGSLSATEQMALAYAFTLAIHSASGKNCPLVIDSPLGRVSDENRENMAKALKEVSKEKQIIMLFTPDEYSEAVSPIPAPWRPAAAAGRHRKRGFLRCRGQC